MSDQKPITPISTSDLRGRRVRPVALVATVSSAVLLVVGAFVIVNLSSDDGPGSLADGSAPADTDPVASVPVASVPADSVPVDAAPVDAVAADTVSVGTSGVDATEPDDEAAEEAEVAEGGPAPGPPVIETVLEQPFEIVTAVAAWTVLDLHPAEPVGSPSPCEASAGTIVASPPAATLLASASSVDVAITYCGDTPSTLAADLGPGATGSWKSALVFQPNETAEVSIFVDRDNFPIGAFSTYVRFTDEDGSSTEVPIAGMSFGRFSAGSGSGTLSAGGAAPGCSGSCIVRAELTPGAGVADVGLRVDTNVAATMSVYVFGQAPLFLNGQPVLVGASPVASSATGVTTWTTALGDLEPGTTYHLLLQAVDGQNRRQWAVHSFTTLAPLPGQFTGDDPEPGCSANCIVEAQLQSTPSHATVALHVETHTPAKLTAQVGTGIVWQNGEPVVQGAITDSTFAEFVTSWDATFDGLAGSTAYHVVVRATDDNGNTDIQTGEFATAAAPPVAMLVRFEKLLVRWDADSSSVNRGELRFAWGINNTQLGSRGEAKHHTGDQITLESATNGWYVPFHDDDEHLFTLAGGERDPGSHLCSAEAGDGVPTWREQDRHDCDNVKWNTAPMRVGLADVEAAPFCSEYGIGGAAGNRRCLDVDSPNFGDDVPRFASIVSFEPFG